METKKMKVAIYCRVASSDDYAIENQRRSLIDFAAAQGYNSCVEYLDNGVSGISLDRPAFSRLDNDIIEGKIQTVFVKNVCRIGRDTFTTMKWLDKMKSLGVEVISLHNDLEFNNTLLPLLGEIMKRESEVGKNAS